MLYAKVSKERQPGDGQEGARVYTIENGAWHQLPDDEVEAALASVRRFEHNGTDYGDGWDVLCPVDDAIRPLILAEYWDGDSRAYPVAIQNWGALIITIDVPSLRHLGWGVFEGLPVSILGGVPDGVVVEIYLRLRELSRGGFE